MKGPVNFLSPATGQIAMPSNRFFYRELGRRCPRKGEWYLSGAIVEAYQAPSDLSTEFMVVEKTRAARRVTIEVPA